jgi:hypothetical protein
MLRPIFFITVAFALVVASPQNARAALCFQYTKSGGGVSVAQADLPAPNTCQTLALYEVGTNPALTLLAIRHLPLHIRGLPALAQRQLLRVGDLPTPARP